MIVAVAILGCRSKGEQGSPPRRDAASASIDAAPVTDAPQADTTDMIELAAGAYTEGCDQPPPQRCMGRITSSPVGRFYIDRTEVTVESYLRCVERGACQQPTLGGECDATTANWAAGRARHPMNCLTPGQALAYCLSLQKRLPATDEWEKAARGLDGRTYPWGNEPPSCRVAQIKGCGKGTAEVGAHPQGDSPFGLGDTVGNVAEIVLSWPWAEYMRAYVDYDIELFAERHAFLARGGSYRRSVIGGYELWNAEHGGWTTSEPSPELGFRCAVSFEWRE